MSIEERRIGKYELRERLGRGGVNEVWKAFDTQLHRYVAIKLLHEELQNDPDFVKRFVREARMVASLHHPNIVQVHDFQVSQSPESASTIAYMVMDYIEGQTLADYIHNTSAQGQFPSAADIVHLFLAISSAIDYAHQQGMIHRDIKPANILLDKRRTIHNSMGEPILTDFGIAKLLGASSGAMSGSWLGTPLYIAPEQVQGYPGNERSDIYALGVILYEICTGMLPFRGENPTAIMMQHIKNMPISPAFINPHISPALSTVILRSLAKDPAARFQSASSMAAALAQAFNIPIPESPGQVPYSNDVIHTPISLSPGQPHLMPSLAPSVTPFPPHAVATPTPPLATPSSSRPGPGEASPNLLVTPAGNTPGVASVHNSPLQVSLPLSTVVLSSTATPVLPSPTPVSPLTPIPSYQPPPAPKRRSVWLLVMLVASLIIILGGFGLGSLYLLSHKGPVAAGTSRIAGHAFYLSSGLLSEDSNQGIDDEFQIDLQNIPIPAPGKSYYGWLLGDRHKNTKENHCHAQQELIFLGKLPVNQGIIHVLYPGDQQHTNLIGCTSRFLITEENAESRPGHPATDRSAWRYYAELPQTPDPKDAVLHLSALDELRHLLFEGSNLQLLGVHGGLDIRFLRNSQKIWEWASSARDSWGNTTDVNFTHRQLVRILDYIDGTAPHLVQTEVPPGTPVLVNPKFGMVGMIDLPKKTGSYVGRISHQLNTIAQDPDVTPKMRALATQLSQDISNIRLWLEKVHQDAKQLVTLNETQLQQPAALVILDDMQTQATYAFVGHIDPSTNKVQAGVSQVHDGTQQLATFDVAPYPSQ